MNYGSRPGWIEVISGVMFAGKSEELIRRVRRAIIARRRVAATGERRPPECGRISSWARSRRKMAQPARRHWRTVLHCSGFPAA